MLNQIIFVGKIKEIKDVNGETIVSVENSRPFKNENGEYEKDVVDFKIWDGVADTTKEYCKKGDVLGIRGRVQTREVDSKKEIELIADRISFLSANTNIKKDDDNENN